MSATMTIPLPVLSPEDLARMFWQMDADEQAKFFNQLGVEVMATLSPFERKPGSWFTLDWQMYQAAHSDYALPLGRRAMETMAQASVTDYLMPYALQEERQRQAEAMLSQRSAKGAV